VLSNLDSIGSVEVNAFQSHAAVVLQKSTREGFGLTVSEGLWKARPVVAGAVGGIPLQVEDGVTGYLVDSSEACAERCLEILDRPEPAHAMARRGKEHVREHFLTPRLLRDYLRIFNDLLAE
jgi:trehalose synthase